jgi:hypothetical protein
MKAKSRLLTNTLKAYLYTRNKIGGEMSIYQATACLSDKIITIPVYNNACYLYAVDIVDENDVAIMSHDYKNPYPILQGDMINIKYEPAP